MDPPLAATSPRSRQSAPGATPCEPFARRKSIGRAKLSRNASHVPSNTVAGYRPGADALAQRTSRLVARPRHAAAHDRTEDGLLAHDALRFRPRHGPLRI